MAVTVRTLPEMVPAMTQCVVIVMPIFTVFVFLVMIAIVHGA